MQSNIGLNQLSIGLNSPPRNFDGADKGKASMSGEVVGADGFVPARTRNKTQGQKRTLQERQEEDTFNKFEALDDLSL